MSDDDDDDDGDDDNDDDDDDDVFLFQSLIQRFHIFAVMPILEAKYIRGRPFPATKHL